jgi:hypothetical protein
LASHVISALYSAYNPSAKEVGGLKVSLYEAAQNFELFSNIQDKN